jgi:hypothetical protein
MATDKTPLPRGEQAGKTPIGKVPVPTEITRGKTPILKLPVAPKEK